MDDSRPTSKSSKEHQQQLSGRSHRDYSRLRHQELHQHRYSAHSHQFPRHTHHLLERRQGTSPSPSANPASVVSSEIIGSPSAETTQTGSSTSNFASPTLQIVPSLLTTLPTSSVITSSLSSLIPVPPSSTSSVSQDHSTVVSLPLGSGAPLISAVLTVAQVEATALSGALPIAPTTISVGPGIQTVNTTNTTGSIPSGGTVTYVTSPLSYVTSSSIIGARNSSTTSTSPSSVTTTTSGNLTPAPAAYSVFSSFLSAFAASPSSGTAQANATSFSSSSQGSVTAFGMPLVSSTPSGAALQRSSFPTSAISGPSIASTASRSSSTSLAPSSQTQKTAPATMSSATSSAAGGLGGAASGNSVDASAMSVTTKTLVGGVVGGVAGLAVVLLLVLLLLRWYKRQRGIASSSGHHELGPEMSEAERPAPLILHPAGASNAGRTPGASAGAALGGTAAVTGLMKRLGRSRGPPPNQQPPPIPAEGSGGFQRISGRKLPSQFSPGVEGPVTWYSSDQGASYPSGSSAYPSGGTFSSLPENPFADPSPPFGPTLTAAEAGVVGGTTIHGARREPTPVQGRGTIVPGPGRSPTVRHADYRASSHLEPVTPSPPGEGFVTEPGSAPARGPSPAIPTSTTSLLSPPRGRGVGPGPGGIISPGRGTLQARGGSGSRFVEEDL